MTERILGNYMLCCGVGNAFTIKDNLNYMDTIKIGKDIV